VTFVVVALIWGAFSGYLLLRTLDSLLAIIICLHGLLMTRWKRLTSKAAPGQIKSAIILRVMLQVALIGLLCGYLLSVGDRFVRREFWFEYQGNNGILWGVMAGVVAVVFLRGAWRRLVVVWKMTHEFDYAEKRKRTFLLKV
jgi:hypothetical protein